MRTSDAIVDKCGVLEEALAGPLHLELGCGASKRHVEAIGIDAIDLPGVDVVGDVQGVLDLLPAASVSRVSCYHFMEHVPDLEALLASIDRVLVPGGVVVASVPHWSNPHYYSDPTHVRQFGLYTFSYLCEERLLRRRVPQYSFTLPWRVTNITLRFGTDRVFPIRRFVRRAVGRALRVSYRLVEHYEDTFAWVFPAYELEFRLEKLWRPADT